MGQQVRRKQDGCKETPRPSENIEERVGDQLFRKFTEKRYWRQLYWSDAHIAVGGLIYRLRGCIDGNRGRNDSAEPSSSAGPTMGSPVRFLFALPTASPGGIPADR